MTFWLSIMEKMDAFPNEKIHITPECIMHFHGHQNKVVPFMKPSIFTNLNNGTRFCNYTYWSTNDTWNHHLSYWVNNHHIGNENLVVLGHVKIGL